jgi:hypothetical protein
MYQISDSLQSIKLCLVANLNGEIYLCFVILVTMTESSVMYQMCDSLRILSNYVLLPT